jgi:hypothetical protein
MDKNETPIEKITVNSYVMMGLVICAAGIILAGLIGPLYDYIRELITLFF